MAEVRDGLLDEERCDEEGLEGRMDSWYIGLLAFVDFSLVGFAILGLLFCVLGPICIELFFWMGLIDA